MKDQKGFTLIEVLVTMGILSFCILGVISMQFAAMSSNYSSGTLTEATTYATDKMEKLVHLSYDHADVTVGDHGPQTEGIYSISWTVSNYADASNAKSVNVTVTWTDSGMQRNVSMQYVKPDLD